MQNDPELPPYAIESVFNALRLLSLFRHRESLRVTDASAELGVAASTAHRLLMTMTHAGFVQQERNSRAYRPGPELLHFAFATAAIAELREIARPHMARLGAQVDETINLLVLEGRSVRFAESVECTKTVRVSGRLGALLPAHSTSGGKVLLAALSTEEVKAMHDSGLSRLTDHTITGMRAFTDELDEIRYSGYAVNIDESLDGLHAVSVPVTDAAGRLVAALAVSVPAARGGLAQLRSYVPPLKETSAQIGSRL